MSEPHRTREELLDENRRLRAELAREKGGGVEEGPPGGDFFQRLFHVSPVALSLSELQELRIMDVNAAMCRLTGYERKELLGHSPVELDLWVDPEDRDEMLARLEAEGALYDYEVRIRTKAGEIREMRASFQRLENEDGDTLLSVLSDVSMRKQTRRSLRKAKQEAERARAEAQDLAQFRSSVVTNVTHEVRTPLTVILGFTSILREGVDGPYRRFVDLIERSGRRLLMTLDSLLDLAQLESGTLDVDARPHNVLDVMDSVANTSRSLAEDKGLAFETDLPSQALYAKVDNELLARALRHLVDNAVKFTDEGRVSLRVRAEDNQVLLQVADTGVGIEEAFVPQLFDSFSQESKGMERDYQGSGMGLTVTAQLVERFGGEVRVDTQKGEGSTFTIVLPQVKRSSAAVSSTRAKVA